MVKLSMFNNFKNKKGGFIETVVIIIVAILLMRYFHISVGDVFRWIGRQLQGVF
jgi:hypothetical protein